MEDYEDSNLHLYPSTIDQGAMIGLTNVPRKSRDYSRVQNGVPNFNF